MAKVASHQDGRLSWLSQWETGHPERKWSCLYWRTPPGSPQLIVLHVLEETNVMRKATSVECVQPSRALQNSLGRVYSQQLPFPSSLSPLPSVLPQMAFASPSTALIKNRTWKKLFGAFSGVAHPFPSSRSGSPLQFPASSGHGHYIYICFFNQQYTFIIIHEWSKDLRGLLLVV